MTTDIALKTLFGERAKYEMLVSGNCFATILMTQGLALFFGILDFCYATATNIRAPWEGAYQTQEALPGPRALALQRVRRPSPLRGRSAITTTAAPRNSGRAPNGISGRRHLSLR